VELDEILRALDPRTRADLQDWLQSMAVATEGRGKDLNATIGNLAPFAEDTNRLLEVLRSQSGALRRVVANTGEVFEALSEREGQLAGLITNGDRVFAATAERNRELQEAFRALPTFEREARTTIDRLDDFAQRTNPLVSQLRPAARELSPTLQGVEELSPDLRALFEDLGPAITASREGLPRRSVCSTTSRRSSARRTPCCASSTRCCASWGATTARSTRSWPTRRRRRRPRARRPRAASRCTTCARRTR
jgi:ABC-type transporter Mla subunit MlaD